MLTILVIIDTIVVHFIVGVWLWRHWLTKFSFNIDIFECKDYYNKKQYEQKILNVMYWEIPRAQKPRANSATGIFCTPIWFKKEVTKKNE